MRKNTVKQSTFFGRSTLYYEIALVADHQAVSLSEITPSVNELSKLVDAIVILAKDLMTDQFDRKSY